LFLTKSIELKKFKLNPIVTFMFKVILEFLGGLTFPYRVRTLYSQCKGEICPFACPEVKNHNKLALTTRAENNNHN
jgi:hypothetical protein